MFVPTGSPVSPPCRRLAARMKRWLPANARGGSAARLSSGSIRRWATSRTHGAYRAIRTKHLPRYLAKFTYHFNRRFDLARMVGRLDTAAVLRPPMPYRFVKVG